MSNPVLTSNDIQRLASCLQQTRFYEFPATFPALTIADVINFLYANHPMVYAGAGIPNGVVAAFYGSIYDQDNGEVWRKSSPGYGNTGWDKLL